MYPTEFIKRKAALARHLAAGECGGSYGDAVIILSSAVSAVAADLFRGKRIDRRRFVQLWVRYADVALNPLAVSVPLLAQHLHENDDEENVACLRHLRPEVLSFFPNHADSLVLSGGTADLPETAVATACSTLGLPKIREFTYPALFYAHIRNGFVHEGDTTEFGSSHPGGSRPADISYANVIQKPFRRIHFDLEWLIRVAESIAENATLDVYKPRSPLPNPWWLDGGAP